MYCKYILSLIIKKTTILNYDNEKGFSTFLSNFKTEIPKISSEVEELFSKINPNKKFKTLLDDFFDADSFKDSSFKTWLNSLSDAEKVTLSAGDALNQYQSYLQSTAKQTTTFATITQKAGSALKTIGGAFLSTFANMAVMYAASAAIEAIGTAIYNTIHATEIAIEKGEEAKQVIADIGDAYNSKKNIVDTNKDRYIELSVGVNTKTNENLSLTADEYNEFLNITNQLAETFPSLVTGYDAQGNALLSLSGNANDTSVSLEKLLEQERQLADFKVSQNLQDAFDGTITQIGVLQDEIDNTMQRISELEDVKEGLDVSNKSNLTDLGFSKTDDGFEYSLDLFSVNGDNESFERFTAQQNAFIQAAKDAGIEETNNMWQDINENAMDNAGQTGMSWTGHIYNITKDQLDTFTSSYKEAIKESGIDVTESLVDAYQIKSADQKEIQANWNSLVPSLITAMSVYDGYDKLGEGVKQAINTGIGDIDPIKEWLGDDGKVHAPDNIRAYLREKFLDPITDVLESDTLSADQKKTFQDNINNIFSLDKTLNAQEYQTQLNTYLNNIKDMFSSEEAFNDFVLTFGLKFQTEDGEIIDSRDSLMRSISKKVLKNGDNSTTRESLNELTYEQLVNVEATYTDSTNGKSLADVIEEETTKAQNTIDSTEPITFSSLFSSDEEGSFNKTIDEFQSNISTIESALEGLNSGDLKSSDITDLMQQFPELIGQSDNLGQALSNLKAKNLSNIVGETFKQVKQLGITGSEQLSAVDDFVKNLFEYVDLSGVDLSDLKRSLTSQLLQNASDSVERNMVSDWLNNLFKDIEVKAKLSIDIDVENTDKILSQINAVNSVLSSQSTGKSISIEDFNSDELKDYQSALEYVNGSMQLNIEKVQELTKAKAEEQIATNDAKKAMEQSKYMENIAQIEMLQDKLRSLDDTKGENAQAIQSSIDALLSENDTIVNQCSQLDILSASLREATGAYQNWLDKQNGSESGDMFDDAMGALNHIEDVTQNTKSDDYGRIGKQSYKAAVEFLVPDTIDSQDAEAVSSYIDSIEHYFNHDSDGNRTGLDVAEFCAKATKAGLMELDEATNEYKILGQRTMQDFADGLNLSLPMVQAMFGEMEEFGGQFDWADEAVKTLGDLGMAAGEAKDRLESIDGNQDLNIQIDVSDIETTEDKISTLENTISQMQNYKSTLEVDSSQVEDANAIIQYCITQKQMLEAPTVMTIDASQVSGEIGNALSLLQQFQEAKNNVELQAEVGADTSEAQGKVDSLVSEIQSLSPEIKAQLGIDGASEATIASSIQGITPEILVKAGVDSALVDAYAAEEKQSKGTVTWDNKTGEVDAWASQMHVSKGTVSWGNDISQVKTYFTATGHVNWENSTPPSGGAHGLNGTAHASGTAHYPHLVGHAYAKGNWGTKTGGMTLVGELGREIVVNPFTGTWETVGDNGAEFKYIPAGSIVFNHLQSESLLERGFINSRGLAKASGTAMVRGGISAQQANIASGKTTYKGSTPTKTNTTKTNTTATKQNTSAVNTNTKAVKQSSQAFDWIRVALDRAKSKVEEIAATITDFVSSAYKSAQLQKKITAIDNEIVANQKGYSAYLEKANAVAKKYVYQDDNDNTQSLSIPSKYKKLVQNGTFSVEDMDTSTAYGKALSEAVQKYQEYYEAAQDCRRAVQELRTEQYEAFQELMNIPTEEAEKKIEKLERKLKSLTAVQSTSSMGGSAIAQLQKLTKANNPEVKKTTDALKKAQDEQAKTAASKSTAAKEKSSANKILQTAKTSTSKSGSTLSKDAKKATNTSANALKNATKKGVSSRVVSAVNSAIKKRQPISSSLLKQLKGSALKAAKDYNAKLKQEQAINKSVSSSKTVSTKGLTGRLLKDAQKYNKDAKAQASAQKVYDKAVSNYNSATSKDNAAKQKVENATLAKKNVENATTQEQRTLISAKSGQASYVYQNKFLDQQLSVAKSENSARQTALEKATKNAENAQKKKQQQTAKIQKQATALLKNKSVTKALNDTQKAALKAGKTVSTTGITDPAVLKKIKAYNDMVKQGTVLNTQYTIALEAQSEAVANAAETEAEYAQMIVENEKQKFENIQNYYNAISDYNQKLSESYAGNRNLKSAKGEDLTEKDYQDEIASRQKDRKILADEEAALRKQLDSAVKSGKIVKGSDEWLEMASQIRDVHNEGQNLDLTIMELQDTMREEVFFQALNKALEKAEALRASLGSINDLISDDMKYDDSGKLTDFGITALAMDIKDYESYLDSMQTLIKKRNEYIKQFNNGNNNTNYSQKEFQEDMKNVSDDIRNLLSQTNDARKSIIDSITSQSKAELDAINKVIDARQNLLKKQKEYYDYDKTLKSKTKDIQLLEQQIAALDGVNDSESKARKAQLEAQLKESKDDLDDTIFEHRYDIQVSGLDDLKTELQDNYDNYVKDLNSNLETIVSTVDTSTANINNCLNTVNDTITKLLNSFNIEGLTGEVVGIPSYASGTKNAKGGLSRINDGNGDEIVILKDGSVLMPLTKGSQVLSARETADQIAFSSLNKEMPTYKIPDINMPKMSQKEPATINPVIQCPITINGNADGQDIARELNKRMPEITKQVSMGIYKDLKKNGY